MLTPLCREGVDLIKVFEGLGDGDRHTPGLQPYQDIVGVWTLGYGATYDFQSARITPLTPSISEDEAERLLGRDIARFLRPVDRFVTVPINKYQRGALTSFAFNLGAGALQASTLLRRINGMEWGDVPNQFLRWVYAGGQRRSGLERRRVAEAMLWLT